MRTIAIVAVFTLLINQTCLSQSDAESYSSVFLFKDGIYLSYADLRCNDPSIVDYRIITRYSAGANTQQSIWPIKRFEYTDSKGRMHRLKKKNIYGFCYRSAVYLYIAGEFYEIIEPGILSLLVRIHSKNVDFYAPSGTEKYDQPGATISSKFLLDFRTGQRVDYDEQHFLALIATDQALYHEYMEIGNSIKRYRKLFMFLVKFNARNQLSLPDAGQKLLEKEAAIEVEFN